MLSNHRGTWAVAMNGKAFEFALRGAKAQIEEGAEFAPKFDADGLIVCIAQEASTGEILMVAYMNAEALRLTLKGVAHYWSRSRNQLWRKGDTSGQVQTVIEARTDCDQDAILIKIEAAATARPVNTGRKSCFYRRIEAPGRQRPPDPSGQLKFGRSGETFSERCD